MRYIVIEGESVALVANRLGVSFEQLYKWKSLYLEATEPSKEEETRRTCWGCRNFGSSDLGPLASGRDATV